MVTDKRVSPAAGGIRGLYLGEGVLQVGQGGGQRGKEGAEDAARIAKDLAYHYKKRSSREEGKEEEQPDPAQG